MKLGRHILSTQWLFQWHAWRLDEVWQTWTVYWRPELGGMATWNRNKELAGGGNHDEGQRSKLKFNKRYRVCIIATLRGGLVFWARTRQPNVFWTNPQAVQISAYFTWNLTWKLQVESWKLNYAGFFWNCAAKEPFIIRLWTFNFQHFIRILNEIGCTANFRKHIILDSGFRILVLESENNWNHFCRENRTTPQKWLTWIPEFRFWNPKSRIRNMCAEIRCSAISADMSFWILFKKPEKEEDLFPPTSVTVTVEKHDLVGKDDFDSTGSSSSVLK